MDGVRRTCEYVEANPLGDGPRLCGEDADFISRGEPLCDYHYELITN